MDYMLHPLGDQAVLIEVGETITLDIHEKIKTISSCLNTLQDDWFIEYIPAFTTVTVFYDLMTIQKKDTKNKTPYEYVCDELSFLLSSVGTNEKVESRTVTIPVCYEQELAPDLEFVAKTNQLSSQEVINIHSSGEYTVYMIGFAPGFPYIGGMSNRIAAPRKETPSLRIPAGSVGIAGKQTGVYPLETPGGWQIIGRTPLKLFQPDEDNPSLLKAGDKIKFSQISYKDYCSLGGKQK
ncbi:5-oxoprolinase subunit PxpB [Litchfieldia salsa]|uniref:5-oxoprolinase subunit PxpB n=1 Tax=Litchfieldia salsa TaxID=930152 RepID=UPI000B8843B1|nr:5-oxoprolinase subunit PxpB [Litchfieldia salsa]